MITTDEREILNAALVGIRYLEQQIQERLAILTKPNKALGRPAKKKGTVWTAARRKAQGERLKARWKAGAFKSKLKKASKRG